MRLIFALPASCALLMPGAANMFAHEQFPLRLENYEQFSSPSASPSSPPYRDALLSLHKSLVSIPSVSGTENAAGTFLVDYLISLGYVVSMQFLPPANNTPEGTERFNVLGWLGEKGRAPRPRVLVSSHIDVVPPYIPYSILDGVEDGSDPLISGRGSVDAKGSVAAQITAVESLRSTGAIINEGDVMLLFVVGEETTGDGMKFFSESLAGMDPRLEFESAIFGEPTENKLACGHKGIAICEVAARGKAGHSGYPWLGKSATDLLMRALVNVLDADLGHSERFGNTTVNVGLINGGVAANVIPKTGSARLAIRIAAGNQSTGFDIVKERLGKIVEGLDREAMSWECLTGYGPVECNCDVEGFESLVVNYGTDVPNLQGDHVRYLYGPGSILVAHADNEALHVSELETAVEGYKKLILHALRR